MKTFFNGIMSLHYLVKLEILITQVLQLRWRTKKLQNLSHLNCGSKFARLNSIDYSVWLYCKRSVQKMHH